MTDDSNSMEKYVGLTANTFKERYGGHKGDFKHTARRTCTTLSGHIWNLKDQGRKYTIEWDLICRAAPFSPITGTCSLCTAEKWQIIYKPETTTLA